MSDPESESPALEGSAGVPGSWVSSVQVVVGTVVVVNCSQF